MSKISLLGDTHFGVRNDSKYFADYMKDYFLNQYYPYLIENNIKVQIQLGDLVDRRKYINYLTLDNLRTSFIDPAIKHNIKTYILVGNHDIPLKNTLDYNSLSQLVERDYKNNGVIEIVEEPKIIEVEDIDHKKYGLITFIPWICDDNLDSCMKLITEPKTDVVVGHFEMEGFELVNGAPLSEGISRDLFSKFKVVKSGHYHKRMNFRNIDYIGTPYEMSQIDINQKKGFEILDMETLEYEYVLNDNTIFFEFFYDEDDFLAKVDEYKKLLKKRIPNKFVKIVVKENKNPNNFEKVIQFIEKLNPYSLKIIEIPKDYIDNIAEDDIKNYSMIDIITKSVDDSDFDEKHKLKINDCMKSLYYQHLDQEI